MNAWRRVAAIVAVATLALSMFSGPVQAANSRDFSVSVTDPTAVSAGGATKFDVVVDSQDNQTIANVQLSIPAAGQEWPGGATIIAVFGPNAGMCSPTNGTSLSCDFGNIHAFGSRTISVVVSLAASVPEGNVTFSASAETNNENGSNLQVEPGTAVVNVQPFSENGLATFNLGGIVGTSPLGSGGAGNLQTTVNLLQNNGGNGNTIGILEGTNADQPAYCIALHLTCQPDFTDVTVNTGATVTPYLETILTAKVPKRYSLRKAFVIHLRSDGSVETGFPLFNHRDTSCAAHPALVPCADFSLTRHGILTVTVHTASNGKFQY